MTMRFLFLAVAAMLATACVQVPRQDLNAYASAYAQAEAAGDQLLDVFAPYFPEDLTPAGAVAPDPDACLDFSIDAASGVRTCYDPVLALGAQAERSREPVFGQVRRAALRIIGDYNRMLVGLASGETADDVAARIDRGTGFAQSLASFDPTGQTAQVTTLLGLVKPLAVKLESYRASNAAARSVAEAQPDVSALIRAMIEDTRVLYGLYGGKRIREYGILLTEREIAGIDEDQAALARIDADLAAITAEAAAVEAALNAYVRLLDQSDAALVSLASNIGRLQSDPAAATAEFIRVATEARMLSASFVSEIRALQAARN